MSQPNASLEKAVEDVVIEILRNSPGITKLPRNFDSQVDDDSVKVTVNATTNKEEADGSKHFRVDVRVTASAVYKEPFSANILDALAGNIEKALLNIESAAGLTTLHPDTTLFSFFAGFHEPSNKRSNKDNIRSRSRTVYCIVSLK